jgi:hypothetical protein
LARGREIFACQRANLAAHEIDFPLDALERGHRRIILDKDGDAGLV